MELRKVRRQRLRQLINEGFGGVAAALARKLDWQPAEIGRYFTPTKDGRNISERKAREIERKCKLERYWLDQEAQSPLSVQQTLATYNISDAEQSKVLDAYSYLTPEQQEDIIDQMRAYRSANEAAVKHLSGRFKTVTKKRAAEKLPPAPTDHREKVKP